MAVGATVVLSSQHQTGRRRIFCVHKRSQAPGPSRPDQEAFVGRGWRRRAKPPKPALDGDHPHSRAAPILPGGTRAQAIHGLPVFA